MPLHMCQLNKTTKALATDADPNITISVSDHIILMLRFAHQKLDEETRLMLFDPSAPSSDHVLCLLSYD
ncbi:hypothetical protein BCON_0386g00030 [Botryotinia convoluta]|uniref:Uncharacterized protein n=1 Tax=Botryotinia convoluta TaxID=54673 RepID=A0A4Z1HB78_9HELO|nr:hypothetical protein BCON_0386g00030 [Botryotinia convoluta]